MLVPRLITGSLTLRLIRNISRRGALTTVNERGVKRTLILENVKTVLYPNNKNRPTLISTTLFRTRRVVVIKIRLSALTKATGHPERPDKYWTMSTFTFFWRFLYWQRGSASGFVGGRLSIIRVHLCFPT